MKNEKLTTMFLQSNVSQCEFASMIGISQPQLNKYISKSVQLTESTFERLKRAYTISYYTKLITHKLECYLNTKDVDKTSFEFNVQHNNLIIECYVHNAKHAYRNYYDNNGICIGKYKSEPNHSYEFDEVVIMEVFDNAQEDYINWEYTNEVNEKLFELWKI